MQNRSNAKIFEDMQGYENVLMQLDGLDEDKKTDSFLAVVEFLAGGTI
ncbi:MAG: hypothetical protein FWG10_00165 [Eubacteriaceae bacterium]|nr:hypothetical protein [Eubacteriaceae bacterium]